MNTTIKSIAAATFAALGFAASSQAYAGEEWKMTVTPASSIGRADVVADTMAALKDGSLSHSEASYTVQPSPFRTAVSRAQVAAEAKEAIRLGLIPVNEGGARVATVQETEQIRRAGLRALDASVRVAAN